MSAPHGSSPLRRARRLAGLAADLLGKARVAQSGPIKLTYIVTDECSCRCAICHLWKDPRRGATTSEIEALFRANPGVSWINLSGGEVAEREDFGAIAAAAVGHTRCAVIDFPTAGQRPEQVARAARAALDAGVPRLFVTVSLDGPPAIHDALRGADGAFARARESIRELRAIADRRLTVHAGLTFSSRNSDAPERLVDELLAAAPELRREDLHFNLAHHAPHYYRNRPGDRPHGAAIPALRAFLAGERGRRGAALDPFAALENAYWRLADDYLATGRSPVACSALEASVYVDPDFTLYPCATWDRPLANLRDHGLSIARALATAAAREARAAAERLDCPNCWTPCEAYPTLLSRPLRALAALAREPVGDAVHSFTAANHESAPARGTSATKPATPSRPLPEVSR